MWAQGQTQRYAAEPDYFILFERVITLSCLIIPDFTCFHFSHCQKSNIPKPKRQGDFVNTWINSVNIWNLEQILSGTVAFQCERRFRCRPKPSLFLSRSHGEEGVCPRNYLTSTGQSGLKYAEQLENFHWNKGCYSHLFTFLEALLSFVFYCLSFALEFLVKLILLGMYRKMKCGLCFKT